MSATQLPWRAAYNGIYGAGDKSSGLMVATCYIPSRNDTLDVATANAKLIETAVNNHAALLAALEAMVDACNKKDTNECFQALREGRDNARRVIRQAKGEA